MSDRDLYDEYWQSFEGMMERRQDFFVAMNRLDALSRELSEEAYYEYVQRERQKAELEADG